MTRTVATLLVILFGSPTIALAGWQPVEGQLLTRWAKDVSAEHVHSEYPRPQLMRQNWMNLNGLWDYAVCPKEADRPEKFEGQILVPYPIESALSGVKRAVGTTKRLWYRRTFKAPALVDGGRLLLHFGAVDWHAVIWVNGTKVGEHRGGYDPFTLDITESLVQADMQELVVSVWDPTDAGYQPRGKQVSEPRGIWYTSVTGIWRTVWLEPAPRTHIAALKIVPDLARNSVAVTVQADGPTDGLQAKVTVLSVSKGDEKTKVSAISGKGLPGAPITLALADAKLWSPAEPWLYDCEISLMRGSTVVDRATSYFGMRSIAVGKGDGGFQRLLLNGKSLFQFGPLDQGWWPDGLYTAPTDEALRYDLEMTKRLGFNMIRKHVKVEPARWYYHCDRLGLLVWQDMPNGDGHIGRDKPDLVRTPESAENYRREYRAMIDSLHNHPCIVSWVPFNEGWGQFATNEILAWTKRYDPTRLVDSPSGWADRGTGDMNDIHRYPGPAMPELEKKRAAVLGEFGGLGLPIEGHLWWNKRNWGYRTYKTRAELQQHYEQLIARLRPLIGSGLAAAVYTQTTDVEGEVNGLMTYDRALVKHDIDRLAKLHAKLYLPQPVLKRTTLLPTSEKEPRTWRYTTVAPPGGWQQPHFDDASWKEGPGGFGRKGAPGAVIRSQWHTGEIWLRQRFNLTSTSFHGLHLRIHHDEDAQVYFNGQRVASVPDFAREYEDLPLGEAAARALRVGENTIAVHCRQTVGGQYIDVGIVDVQEQPPTP